MAEQPLTQEQIAQAKARAAAEGFLKRDAVGLDQFVNVLTGGKNDETISARLGRAAKQGKWWGKAGVWILDKIQPQHGQKSIVGDLTRAESTQETETKALTTEDQALGVKK